MADLPPQYNPTDVEEARYQWWDAQGLFQANPDRSRKPYTIVIPPPNITGILHMGHALNNTIQDILIRFQRMQGRNALWVPGTDHAGIATQNVVERALAKEGKRRQDLGRDAFVKRVWDWKEQYGNTILYQLKRLGASCDWRRTRFTMDEGLSEAVTEAFLQLYKKGLIYRGNYIINWCPRCQTALADEEAPRQGTQGKLYHIRYPLAQGSGLRAQGKATPPRAHSPEPPAQFIEVATTRPETMLGDTAVAVHPKDKRYRALIGKFAILPIVNRTLPIIGDDAVDRDFGTGAVKVTPAHDPVDFQLGKKHKLEFINVMTDDAHMTNVPKPYEGLDRFDCRSKLIVDLEQGGFLGAIDEHQHNVGHCYRCHTVVEPRLSPQWFVKMQPLAGPAIKAVKTGAITFVPERWTKVYLNWLEHIEDCGISRQFWWGQRLPVYFCDKCARGSGLGARGKNAQPRAYSPEPTAKGVIVSKTRPERCPTCGSTALRQDEDVLDTWFSSWLWPFSTLGWPKKTPELGYFYPTSTLVTAQEIIFFWVARMIMAGYFCMKQPPFTKVYIHGTVRDMTGKKMSKPLGNIIDPLDIIKQYGTDALRYTLVTATAIGQDIFLSEERFVAGRNFANKLWNATRFALSRQAVGGGTKPPLTVADRWLRSRLHRTIARVTTSLENCLFNDATTALYGFLWHDLCDWYVELSKVPGQTSSPAVLIEALETSLRLLHPVMPFVTEELWQHLKTADSRATTPQSIMTAPWPKAEKKFMDEETERAIERFQLVVTGLRNARADLGIPAGERLRLGVVTGKSAVKQFFESHRPALELLAGVGEVRLVSSRQEVTQAARLRVNDLELLLHTEGLLNVEAQRTRLQQKVAELEQRASRLKAQLKDAVFTQKAPKDVVAQAEQSLTRTRADLAKFSEYLADLSTT